MSNKLYNLSIVRKKLVIEQVREITLHDIVSVRETLNSIDFIMGDDDLWDYEEQSNGQWKAVTKIRLCASEEIVNFIKDNKDKLVMDSIDHTFITDLTQVYRIDRCGKTKQEIQSMSLDDIVSGNKRRIIKKLNETVENLNMLADTMGDIL